MFETYRDDRENNEIVFHIVEAERIHLNDVVQIIYQREAGDIDKIRNELATYLRNEDAKLYVAISNGVVTGFSRCKKYQGEIYSHEGWYLSGVIVKPEYRCAGIGKSLTTERLEFLTNVTDKIYYLVNSNNKVSIKLHNSFGFVKFTEIFSFPGVKFNQGNGYLYWVNTNDLLKQ